MIATFPRDAVASRYETIRKIIIFVEERIEKCPEGRLRVSRKKSGVYYYSVTQAGDINGKIISRNDTAYARQLAQKAYLETILKTAKQEEKMLKQILDRYPDPAVEGIYEQLSQERQDLVTPIVLTDEQYKNKWLAQEFIHKGFSDKMPYYLTVKGERVRSKSEQIIADRLTAKNIPYIYEKPLQVGKDIFHPDFTILRMSDRKELYYEHLGRLGDMGYATDAVDRINKYHRNGFVLGDNLFLTGETGDLPFDVRTLDVLIEQKFL